MTDKEQFIKNVTGHDIFILHDDGKYRHIVFKKPHSSVYWFELVTWPGRLCISGDMGSYVFARIPDMFSFFRNDPGPIEINPGYWSEKCEASDKQSKIEKFDKDRFIEVVTEIMDDNEMPAMRRAEIFEGMYLDDWNETLARQYIHELEDKEFYDFWDYNLKKYTMNFIWCCYAIVWGIRKYDIYKKENEEC